LALSTLRSICYGGRARQYRPAGPTLQS